MVIYLEISEEAKLPRKVRIWEGARIGRTVGEVLIEDAKISSLHAQVEKDAKGGLVLVDQDSANGLRINGQKVKRIAMLLGVRFQVGKTFCKVIEINDEAPPLFYEKPKPVSWREVVLEKLPKLEAKDIPGLLPVAPFRPALQLEFIQGIQLEQQIVLGYGPRQFGSTGLDIELLEPEIPPMAFEILCDDGQAKFCTPFPKIVLLNDKSVSVAPLKEGDLIRIGQTLIRVDFVA